jgi:hypothetical protein
MATGSATDARMTKNTWTYMAAGKTTRGRKKNKTKYGQYNLRKTGALCSQND